MSDIFSEIPEDIVKSVLGQAGFADTLTPEETPTPSPDTLPNESTSGSAPQETEEEVTAPPPSAPGGPLFVDDTDETNIVTLPDGTKYPVALVEEWAKSANRPPPPPVSTTPPPAAETAPTFTPIQLPQLTEEDLEVAGPAVRALLMIAVRQGQEMEDLRTRLQTAQQIQQENANVEASKVLNAATSMFKTEHNLPDDLMNRIAENANSDDVVRHLRENKDPFAAVQYALRRSYWDLPEARQFEFQRQEQQRNQALIRKQKLAGVGGSNGPSSRGAPPIDESTPEGRHQAAVELARQAMYGDEG